METPKEKALSLYKEFHHTCNCTIAGTSTIFREIAKNCALICVRENLSVLEHIRKPENTILLFEGTEFSMFSADEYRDYWLQVKEELKNVY